MTEAQTLASSIDEAALIEFVEGRRWFGAKAEDVAHARVLDTALLRSQTPQFVDAIAEVRFGAGTHQLYQLLLGFRPEKDDWDEEVIGAVDAQTVYEALADPVLARELLHLMRTEATVQAEEGAIEFRALDLAAYGADLSEPRLMTAEQSNTSVVYGEELILKAYRRLEAGINPELELLRFLTQRGFENIASLVGWYSYSGPLIDATLGVLQEFVPNAQDGWELALEELRTGPEAFLARLRRLGEVTGSLHAVLASEPNDPEFCPELPSTEALALLTATVDEEIESIFLTLPDEPALEPIVGRGEEVRERLRLFSHVGTVGKSIRHHGDYHLGQVLWNGSDWIVLDFEGEPARALSERRQKRSPLRDVAGMLRSFAYASSAFEVEHGQPPPEGWEDRARTEFMEGYLATVDQSIIPGSEEAREKLIAIFELEKAAYELRYELNNRPDWVRIPVAGILRILESPL